MILVSAGMQKSGSGLFFNYTNDLLVLAGNKDVRELRNEYNLDTLIKHYNCNIGELTAEKIHQIIPLHNHGHSFAVKTHAGPSPAVRKWMKEGVIKATCIYRDPRDAALSAIAHGEKIRKNGENHTFASFRTLEDTLPAVINWLKDCVLNWINIQDVFFVKYEDLISDPMFVLESLADFLSIKPDNIDFNKIISKYNKPNLDEKKKEHLHFNKGKAGVFREVLTNDEIEYCNNLFYEYLKLLQYDL